MRQEFPQEAQLLGVEAAGDGQRRVRTAKMSQGEQAPRQGNKDRKRADETVEGGELTLLEGTARFERLEVILNEPPGAIVVYHGGGLVDAC